MPYVRKTKSRRINKSARYSRRKRSQPFRRYRTSRPNSIVRSVRPKWQNPLPQQNFFKFKYQDSCFNMSTGAVGNYANSYVFRGNSVYDPDYTGLGVQPYGYDQMSAIYNRYYVYASKIKVYPHFVGMDTPNSCRSVRWIVFPWCTASPTYTEFEDLTSQMRPYKALTMNDPSDQKQNMTLYQSSKKMFRLGTPDEVDAGSTIVSNPSQVWYWIIRSDTTNTNTAVFLNMDIKITYYCKLITENNVNES